MSEQIDQQAIKRRIAINALVDRLNEYALGQVDMTPSQAWAAKWLMDKILANAPQEAVIMGPNRESIFAPLAPPRYE